MTTTNPYSKSFSVLVIALMQFTWAATGFSQSSQAFTSSGTFKVPAGIYSINIETWGGGGAGGGVTGKKFGGGGGGGGGFNRVTNYAVSPGQVLSVTVGAGGQGVLGSDGNAGGNSYVQSNLCLSSGGTGGKVNNGAGGTGGNGLYAGGDGRVGTTSNPGGGGSSAGISSAGNDATGIAGAAAVTGGGKGGNGSSSNGAGNDAGVPGGGGGGAKTGSTNSTFAGGDGGRGQVVISYNISSCATLYWAGENSATPGGTSGKDFNTAANWSIDPTIYITPGFAPGACNDVFIYLELTGSTSGTKITFSSPATTIKSLTFNVKTISSGSSSIYEGGLSLGNQSLIISGDASLYSENNFVNKTTQLTIDCDHANALYTFGGDLTTSAVNNGGGSGECIVYPFSNPVNTQNKGKFILKGNAVLSGVGDDANPQLNKPTTLVFDGTGTQTITNNNSNGYPIYLGFNTIVGEANAPKVVFKGTNPLGFKSINNFTINDGAVVEVEAQQSINRNGNGTPGTFIMKPNALLILRGNNFPSGYATAYTLDASSTVDYAASNGVSQTVGAVSYGNLKFSNASGSGNSDKTLAGNTIIKGNAIIDSYVTFNQGSFTLNRSTAGGSFSVAANAVHNLAAAYPANFSSVVLNATSVTNYNGSAAQNVAPVNYGHLILSTSANKTAVGNISVAGDFSILNTAVFLAGNYTHTLNGNWTNNAGFTANNSTIIFSGSAAQNIGGTAISQFNNLTVSKNNASNLVTNASKALSANKLDVIKGNLVLQATDNDYNISGNVTVLPDGTLTHTVPWDTYNKALRISGNLDVTGIFNPTVRSHVAMSGVGSKTIRTGNNPASTMSILTFSSGNYAANGNLKTNQEVWAMFGTGGSFSTAGSDVTFTSMLNNNGTVNVNGGTLTILQNAYIGFAGTPGIMNVSSGTVVINGDLYNYNNAAITASGTPQIRIKGDWINYGHFNPGNSTTTFYGSIDENISGSTQLNFYNLKVNGTNVIQNMNISVLNDLTVNSGVLDMQDFTCNRASTGGTMILASDCMLKLRAGGGGTPGSNFPANFSVYQLMDRSTVSYSGSIPQQIYSVPAYSNLRLANAGLKTAGGALTIKGDLLLDNGNVFDGGSFTHKIGGNWINNASATGYIYNNGTVVFNGTIPQSIAGNYGTSFNSLVMDNNAGLTIGVSSPVSIYESLSATGAGKSLITNDNLTLKSLLSKTAWVGNMTGSVITGKATVERYVSARKGWRFVSVTTSAAQTVKQAWQENAVNGASNPVPGFGTQITGEVSNWAAAGFDQQSFSPSMKYYDPVNDKWIGIANTNATPISNTKGYMLFVRGDRLATALNSPATETNLRTNGDLKMGNQPIITVLPNKFESVGNPYPSPVDFTKITKGSAVSDVFYVWDPYLAGTFNLGGYQTFSAANGWVPVPGGTTAHPSGMPSTIIQNGEAFMVRGKATGAPADFSLQFTENAKVGVNPPAFARPGGASGIVKTQYLRASLLNATGQLVDGNAVGFDAAYSNGVDGDDAVKLLNSGENIGLKRLGKSLSVEARNLISDNDTIFYNLSNLSKQTYTLQIIGVGIDRSAVHAFLTDKYKKSSLPVSLADTTRYEFVVNSDPLSFASDRFNIVLAQKTVLPVSFTSISASRNGDDVIVVWKSAQEINVKQYEIERSDDGVHFTTIVSVLYNPGAGGAYQWLDHQPLPNWNFYRVRSIDLDGKATVSSIASVNFNGQKSSVNVYPNPLNGPKVYIQFVNQVKGDYRISVYNDMGQQVLTRTTSVIGQNHIATLDWDKRLPRGIYTIKVSGSGDETTITRLKY